MFRKSHWIVEVIRAVASAADHMEIVLGVKLAGYPRQIECALNYPVKMEWVLEFMLAFLDRPRLNTHRSTGRTTWYTDFYNFVGG